MATKRKSKKTPTKGWLYAIPNKDSKGYRAVRCAKVTPKRFYYIDANTHGFVSMDLVMSASKEEIIEYLKQNA